MSKMYQIACLRFSKEKGGILEKEVAVETNDGDGWVDEDVREVLYNIAAECFWNRKDVVELCSIDDELPEWYEGDGFYNKDTHEPQALFGCTQFWDGVYLFTVEELQEWRNER